MLWLAPSARAEDAYVPTAVSLEAPAVCASAAALTEGVALQLGRAPFAAPSDAELVIAISITEETDGLFLAQLELRSVATGEVFGTRSLRSDERDCASLDDPLAVIVAMLLNVQRDELALPTPRSPWQARLSARGGLGLGQLPGPSAEAELEVGAALRDVVTFGVAVGFGWADTVPVAEGTLAVLAGTLRGVVAPILTSGDAIELSLPISVGAGIARGEAAGFAASRAQTVFFFDVGVGLRLSIELAPWLALELGGDLRALPVRPTFYVRNGDGSLEPLFLGLFVAGSLHAGLSLHLP